MKKLLTIAAIITSTFMLHSEAKAYVYEAAYDSGCLGGTCNCSYVYDGTLNFTYGSHPVANGDTITAGWNQSGCPSSEINMGTITVTGNNGYVRYELDLPAGYSVGVWHISFNASTGALTITFDSSASTTCQ